VSAKILFVDDEADLEALIVQKFRRRIRSGEVSLLFAHDGVEALGVLAANPDVDLVVSDINMPRMDGLSLLEKLQAAEDKLSTVIVSAYGDMANIRTAMNRGAFDFVTKPIDFADLEATIAKTLRHVALTREPYIIPDYHAWVSRSDQYAQSAFHAVMVAPLKLARTNDAALERHYLAVADAIDIPVVVQDFPPAVGGITMSVELIAKLAAASPRLSFLKLEDDPAPMKITQIRAVSKDVKIFGGLGGMMFLEELRHGAIGTMTGFAFPEILVDIFNRFRAGDRDGATEVFYQFLPIIRFENQPRINLALRKHIYQLRGVIASSKVRSPFTPVDADTLADLDDILARLELMTAKV